MTVRGHTVDQIHGIGQLEPDTVRARDQKPESQRLHDIVDCVGARTHIGNALHKATLADKQYVESFSAYSELLRRVGVEDDADYNDFATKERWRPAGSYVTAFGRIEFGDIFISFGTANSYLGLGPPKVEKDDLVCVFVGFGTPFIVRKRAEVGYLLVGECYVHGLMNGEGLNMGEEEEIELF